MQRNILLRSTVSEISAHLRLPNSIMVELFIIGLYVQIVFLLRSLEIHTDMGHEGPLGFEGTQNGRKGPSAIAIMNI